MKIKEFNKEFKCVMNEAICEALDKKAMKCGAPAAVLVGSTAMVFAKGNTLLDQLIGAMHDAYAWILGISTALAVLLIAWNILKYMAATDPQTAMMAKKSAIRVAIAWVILNAMGGIITFMTGLSLDNGNGASIWN